MNRILCYLHGRCDRRQQETERLKIVARTLTDLIGIEGVDVCYARRLIDEDGAERLMLSVCLEWSIDHEHTAEREIAEVLSQTAAELQAASDRLEGGAA